jgi:hypothetical protein
MPRFTPTQLIFVLLLAAVVAALAVYRMFFLFG